MIKIREDIATAIDRRRVPSFAQGRLRDLGIKLGLPAPMSLRVIDSTLMTLDFATVTFDSGDLSALTVHGWAQVGLQSDGHTSFRGGMKERGVVGHDYLAAAALLDVKSASGATLVLPHTGNVVGMADIGKDHDEWQDDGFSQLVADQWDTVKRGNVLFRLEVSTNGWQILEPILTGAFGILAVEYVLSGGGEGGARCNWGAGNQGQMTKCG